MISFVAGFSVAVTLFAGRILAVSAQVIGLALALLRRRFSPPIAPGKQSFPSGADGGVD